MSRALLALTEYCMRPEQVRLLTMLDEGNREALEIAIGLSPPSRRVVRELDAPVAVHRCPSSIRVDNGPEFTA